jgi:O-acetylhomoserine (thiol)-lyase
MSPQTAYLQNLGLETLELRFRAASASCAEIARFLETVEGIEAVNYIGLPSSPFYELCKRQFGGCGGAMLTFALKDRAACFAFINRLTVIRRATNLFDNKSLIIHPASTIYGTLHPRFKTIVEVPDNLLRLSVGLEDVEDLKQALEQALKN